MKLAEVEVMARVEAHHWWYRGLRDAVAKSLERSVPGLPSRPRVLDAGCGTGENLRFLRELLNPSYLGGFDNSEEALAFARQKAEGADVYRSDICDPVIHVDELDLVVSLDVVYIPGAERALEGLRRLAARLRRNGLLILNLPAYDWLYSEHDVAIQTSQRFTEKRVTALLANLGLSVELSSYRLCFLFPMVALARLPGIWGARRRPDRSARSDLHAAPGALANRILFAILKAENDLIARGVRLPWGSSVFAIGRKR
jgi:SAM-dependent methyltransferase